MYIYDGEFNVPMNEPAVECHWQPITEGKMLIMDKADEEPLPFTDPPEKWELEADEEEYG